MVKAKETDISTIFKGKHNIFAMECVNTKDLLEYSLTGYFDNVVNLFNSGDVIIAMGNNGTHFYTIRVENNIVFPSSLVAYQDVDNLPRKRKFVR